MHAPGLKSKKIVVKTSFDKFYFLSKVIKVLSRSSLKCHLRLTSLRFHRLLNPVHVLRHLRVNAGPTSLSTGRWSVRDQTYQIGRQLSGIAVVQRDQWTTGVSTARVLSTLSSSTKLSTANLPILTPVHVIARILFHAINANLQLPVARIHGLCLSPTGHFHGLSHVSLRSQGARKGQTNRLYKVIVNDGLSQSDQSDIVVLVNIRRSVLGMRRRLGHLNFLHWRRTISLSAIWVRGRVPFTEVNPVDSPSCGNIPAIDTMRGREHVMGID